jgi:hypothetical protein
MKDMWNVAFQNAWFGPFVIPNVYTSPFPEIHAGPVYNDGPLDGPLEASMHAQWFAQIPVVNAFQARLRSMGASQMEPVCPVGQMLVKTPQGELKCIAVQPASAMIGGEGPGTVSKTTPPNWPTTRTFPVKPFYGFET